MITDDTLLDWADENITIEYEGGKYFLNWWYRDSETGGYDVIRTDEHTSMFDALKGAIEWVEGNLYEERKIQESQAEYDLWEQVKRIANEQ